MKWLNVQPKFWITLLLSLAIPMLSLASNTYIYPPGLAQPINHWLYPSIAAMNGDVGFFGQDIYKIALNLQDGNLYYLSNPAASTWTLIGGGGGSGGGNVSSSGVPTTNQTAVWTDSTHIKGVTPLNAGTGGQVLTKNSATDYDWAWTTAPGGGGGGTVTNIATTFPVIGGPIQVTGTIALDPTTVTNWNNAITQAPQWNGGATGLVPATGRTSLGLVIGTNVEAWDADLDALSALTGTNTIYYRSGTSTWSAVTMGGNMTFSGGVLNSSAGGGGAPTNATYILETSNASLTSAFALGSLGTGLLKNTTTTGVPTVITDNSANWNTAFSNTLEWNGGSTNLVASTGRASLSLDQVSNNLQANASIYPNTIPAAGRIPVGNSGGTAYAPVALSGSGATMSLSSAGVLSISGIANASLANSSMIITGDTVSLGGTLTQDQITGLSATGIVKRTGTNTLAIATLNSDYTQGVAPGASGNVMTSNGSAWTSQAQPTHVVVRTFGSSTTYSPSAAVNALYVEGVGGGGGGGGVNAPSGNFAAGGGGGGGGYGATYISSPASSYTITIGAAGGGGAAGASGTAGGTTSFGTVLVVGGGNGGGAGANFTTNLGGVTGVGGPGGVATTATSLVATGSDGGFGLCWASGPFSVGGFGGASHFGGDTAGGYNSQPSNAGAHYGGGGSGAAGAAVARAGGAGAPGVVVVWEIY